MILSFLALAAPDVYADPLVEEIEFDAVHVVGEPPVARAYQELPDRMAVEAELARRGLGFEDAELVTGSVGGWRLKKIFGEHPSETRVELAQQDSLRWVRLGGGDTRVEDERAGWYGNACAVVDTRLASLELSLYDGRTEASSSRVVLADGHDRTAVLATLAPGDSVMIVEAEGRRKTGSRVRLRRGSRALDLRTRTEDVRACYHGKGSM